MVSVQQNVLLRRCVGRAPLCSVESGMMMNEIVPRG